MQSTSLTRISLWLVDRRPVFKFLWGLSLSGITGWIALQEGERACGFSVLCILWQRNSLWNRAAPLKPWRLWFRQPAVRVCSVPDVIRRMHKPCYCLTATAGGGLQSVLLSDLPCLRYLALSHCIPQQPRWSSCAWRILKSSSSVWDGVGDLAFHSPEKAEALRGESGSWT